MPKAEPMTAKAIGKAIKAKGLQKLKFFCQMCQKQCRDANGFKCHTQSEGHQRQLLLFADNPNKYLGSYSGEFLKDFLHLLRTRFGTRKVLANAVYQEYIKDRNHVHMNSTRWVTLTGLCKWLGRKGIAEVEETEKGWFLTYIDRSPETMKRLENQKKNEKLDRDYDERISKIIQEQIERGKAAEEKTDKGCSSSKDEASKSLVRTDESKIAFTLNVAGSSGSGRSNEANQTDKQESQGARASLKAIIKETAKSSWTGDEKCKRKQTDPAKKSSLELLKEEEEKMKAKKFRQDHWLTEGIVVKVMTKKLGEEYYKSKGHVREVINRYEGVIDLIDTDVSIKVDQKYLETVLPAIGRTVKVVNGPYVGSHATLLAIDVDSFTCQIKLTDGPFIGRKLDRIAYDDVCKVY